MWVIDSIEEGVAALEIEEGKTVSVPLSTLPDGCKEGDVLIVMVDKQQTEKRREETLALQRSVFCD